MTDTADLLDAAAAAAVSLAARRPWREIALRDIAQAAGLPMTALYGVARSKEDVVDAVLARLDRAAADGLDLNPETTVRERVFDAAMARYDAMEAQRAGIVSILDAELSGPSGAVRLLPRTARTARWLLELAGVDTSGPAGAARVTGMTGILARTTRAWLRDDAGGLPRTMAELDRALRDAESWLDRLAALRPRRRAAKSGRTAEAAAPEEAAAEKAADANGAGGRTPEA